MAFTEFYIQPTGSNLNAGSTNSDAASLTYSSGTWVASTGVMTVASGNPLTDGVLVGDWVSVYPDGNSVTPFVGQVTARDSTTITVSLTNKFGTAPTNGTSNRTLKVGGAWADFGIVAVGSALNSGTVTQSTRINVKAGTYPQSVTRSLNLTATASFACDWVGYKTVPGDQDDTDLSAVVDGTDFPYLTFSGGACSVDGVGARVRNFSFLCTASNLPSFSLAAQSSFGERIRSQNTHTTSGARAVSVSSTAVVVASFFKSPSTATSVGITSGGSGATYIGCEFQGGGLGLSLSAPALVMDCVFNNNGGSAISTSGTNIVTVVGCSIYSPGGSGIIMTGANVYAVVMNCIFSECTGPAINSSAATNVNKVILNNLYHSNNGGGSNFNGLGDVSIFGTYSDVSSPFVDAANGDFRLVDGSNAIGNAFPGRVGFSAQVGVKDIGAVQKQTSGSHSVIGCSFIKGKA